MQTRCPEGEPSQIPDHFRGKYCLDCHEISQTPSHPLSLITWLVLDFSSNAMIGSNCVTSSAVWPGTQEGDLSESSSQKQCGCRVRVRLESWRRTLDIRRSWKQEELPLAIKRETRVGKMLKTRCKVYRLHWDECYHGIIIQWLVKEEPRICFQFTT